MLNSFTLWALSIVLSLECNFRHIVRRQHLSPSWSQEQSKYQRSCSDRQKLFCTIRKLQSLNIHKSLFRVPMCLIYKTYKLIISNLILKTIRAIYDRIIFSSFSFLRFGLLLSTFAVTKFFCSVLMYKCEYRVFFHFVDMLLILYNEYDSATSLSRKKKQGKRIILTTEY